MKVKLFLVSITLSLSVLPAIAQEAKVLKESEITESAIIDALAPEKKTLNRTFKPIGNQVVSAPEQPRSASLLITFEVNSAELTYKAKQALDKVGRALNMDKLADFKFSIEGHTDLSGSYELNQRLSQARAERVMSYLIHEHGIDSHRLNAIGRSYSQLLNKKNPTAQENRRVEFRTKL